MTLPAGRRLGPYEILGPLGAGGMGEVYRARDTRLQRTVALKIIPAHLSGTPSVKERFEREARTISSLNHPHICHLYDVGADDGVDYLVMEYLEGESLEQRLSRGPLPPAQALEYGRQLCEGLDLAHRSGVVHRDLKPGNIMLTPSGAKLMDFGLALPIPREDPSSHSALATMAQPLTQAGMVVGTFQYMSPEQLEGADVGPASDIFSLGAVLYEMVAGRRAFDGKSRYSVASAILESNPEPIAVTPSIPPSLDHAIRVCLEKQVARRWQSARDLAHVLSWIGSDRSAGQPRGGSAPRARLREWIARAALVLLAVAATAGATAWSLRRGAAPAPATSVVRTWIKSTPGSSFLISEGSGFALSPDGRALAFVAAEEDGPAALWLRPIDALEARRLPGTEGALYPFWSADSRSLAFFAAGKLRTVDLASGTLLTVCAAADGRGGTWNDRGEILFAPSVNSSIHKVLSSGGTAAPVTTLDPARGEISHRWPWFLPDGRHFLYLAGSVFTSTENPTNTVLVGALDGGNPVPLIKTHAGAIHAGGHILFLRKNTLMAQPFDPGRLELTGSARPVADPVQEAQLYSKGLFSATDDGLLAYLPLSGEANRQLVWYDRSGKQLDSVPAADAYASVRISPDGSRLLYYVDSGSFDVWSWDLGRKVKIPQTFGAAHQTSSIFPIWSPDGRRIAFTLVRNGKYSLAIKEADGSDTFEEVVEGVERYRFAADWSPDGGTLAYSEGHQEGHAIWMLRLEGERRPHRFLEGPFSTREPKFSPDGRWIAYVSNEPGEYNVFVAPFPGPGGRWQVSSQGGTNPRWRRDGKEIFFVSADDRIVAADITTHGSTIEVGPVRPLFLVRTYGVFSRLDVAADGQSFVVPREPGSPGTALALVSGWPAIGRR